MYLVKILGGGARSPQLKPEQNLWGGGGGTCFPDRSP